MQTLQGKSNRFELKVVCWNSTYHNAFDDHLPKELLIAYLVRCGITKEAAKLFADTAILSEQPIVLSLGVRTHKMYTRNGCSIELKDISNRTFTFHEN